MYAIFTIEGGRNMWTMNLFLQSMDMNTSQKYDLPDWMRKEKLDNCSGFVDEYYHDMNDRVKGYREYR